QYLNNSLSNRFSILSTPTQLALSTWTFGSTHKCYLRSCEFCHTHHSIHNRDDGPAFPEVYQEGLNQRYSTKASLKLMPNAQPILHPKHSLPLADLPRVSEDLNTRNKGTFNNLSSTQNELTTTWPIRKQMELSGSALTIVQV
ncbi:unnamed protein product, partial [Hymenolepis diminuta]